jgi:hypothetical protein
MKPTHLLAATLLGLAIAASPLCAGESSTTAADAPTDVQKFGAPITVKKTLAVAKLDKKPSRYNGKKVKIEGTVRDVCQGRGCWIEIESADGATFLAKSLDESVLVPKDCQGWQVVVQGVVKQLNAKGHEGHDHAHVEGEEAHSCPAPSYVVATQGVELRKAAQKK